LANYKLGKVLLVSTFGLCGKDRSRFVDVYNIGKRLLAQLSDRCNTIGFLCGL
jgi:hypothetical protein